MARKKRRKTRYKRQRCNQTQTRDDIVGHLCMRVLFNLQLQQEAIEYIDKRPQLRIMQDYVEARFDYLLDKFPDLKQQYEKSATQESQKEEKIDQFRDTCKIDPL